MNDTELDRLLNAWEAPAPPPSLREGLQARFPRRERRSFVRPMKWVLVVAVASATLAIGVGQSGAERWDFHLVRALNRLYEGLVLGLEARRASATVARIRQAAPRVYVDGQLAPPLGYANASSLVVQIPGEGVYSVLLFHPPGLTGWDEAGHIHDHVIEFQVSGRQVRIDCDRAIVDSEAPVWVRGRL